MATNRIRTDDPDVPTHAIEVVTARVEQMITEAGELRIAVLANSEELATEKSARKLATKRFYLTIVILILMILGLGALTVANRALSESNRKLNVAADETLSRLDDCLIANSNPKSCYARQQSRTAALLGEPQGPINTVTILTAVCTRIYLDRPIEDVDDGKKRIVACVEQELRRRAAAAE